MDVNIQDLLEPRVLIKDVAAAVPCSPRSIERYCERAGIPIAKFSRNKRSLERRHVIELLTGLRARA